MIKNVLKLSRTYCSYARSSMKKSPRLTKTFFNQQEKESILSSILLTKRTILPEEWKTVREDILNTTRNITTTNIDSAIINFCIQNECLEKACNYIKYVKATNLKLNLGGIGKYFKLHSLLHKNKLSTNEDEKNILAEFQNLCKVYPILDSITSENVILGLSVTKDWRKCLEILENIKISSIPSRPAYNATIAAAFVNQDFDLGWKLFHEMIENNRIPNNNTYLTYLNEISKNSNEIKSKKLDDLFEFSSCFDLKYDEEVANKILQINNGNAKNTIITKTGICKNCKKQLQPLRISTSEFEEVKKEFFENVIVGKNVFCKTSPEELERFKTFIENMGKFDVVIDGLNSAYAAGVRQSHYVQSTLLVSVVRHFVKNRKRILVCGRNHMQKYPKENWNFIKKNATVFLTENISQDDPYMLYCCLQSGINTIIVSRDYMRSHLFLLKNKQNKLLFNRWLTQSRYHLLHATPEKVSFKTPLPYMIAAQRDGNSWHVPYSLEDTVNSSKTPTYRWLCINT